MTSSSTASSSLTSEASLTHIHGESDLQIEHTSRHTTSGILIGEGLTSGYCITPPSKKKSTSWIWKHGEAITRLKDAHKFWLCQFCYKDTPQKLVIRRADATSHGQRHLIEQHQFDATGCYKGKDSVLGKRKNVYEQVHEQDKAQKTPFNRVDFEGLYTTWALVDNLSLRQATSRLLRDLVSYRAPIIRDAVPQSHNTLSGWINQYYDLCKEKVISHLSQSRSRITISFDGWTSSSNMDVVAVVAHYINANYKRQAVLLSLKPTYGSHSGDNLSECLFHTIREFKLQSNIAFFIADNASPNDIAIELLSKEELSLQPKKQRLRCVAHIINLVCKAILLGVDNDCIEDACQQRLSDDNIDDAIKAFEASAQDEQKALRAWRQKGPVGKLHNLVHHVRCSPARRYLFERFQRDVDASLPVYRLITNGGVRWNSTFDMIDRALKLKEAIELYAQHYRNDKDNSTADDILTSEDWLELHELHELLLPFKEASIDVQSSDIEGALWQSLSSIEHLMAKLERMKQQHEFVADTHFKASINLGWKKLDKYYMLSDVTWAYRAAIYLNPCLKLAWFEVKWTERKDWIRGVTTTMETLYRHYQRLYPEEQVQETTSKPRKERSEYQRRNDVTSAITASSELQRYNLEPLWQPPDSDDEKEQEERRKGKEPQTIITWWRDNRSRYPILYRIAMDHLAAPATTAEDEREFSRADDVINNDRPRLADTTAQSIQCLRSWCMSGIVNLREVRLIHLIY